MAVDFSHVKNITIPEGNVKKIEAGGVKLWEKEEELTPLCFTAEEVNSTVGYTITGSLPDIHIQKSADAVNWDDWDGTTTTLANVGDKLYVRNTENTLSTSNIAFEFVMTGKIAGSGNCNSMINFDVLTNYCYYYLFYNCASLTTPPELPATTLANHCYHSMFYNCTSLTTAPSLPAATLADSCYHSMFYGCSSLITPPELSATTLADGCYRSMFQNCTSFTTAPELLATTLANYCYYSMFQNCASLRITENIGTKIFTCPSLSGLTSAVRNMFVSTGGEYTYDPVEGRTYCYY